MATVDGWFDVLSRPLGGVLRDRTDRPQSTRIST